MQTISLAAAAATGFFGVFLLAASGDAQTIPVSNASVAGGPHDAMLIATGEDEPIRPFHIKIPDFAPIDLHARIANTRWPDKETVSDRPQGVHSPIGLAACMLDHDASSLALIARVFDCQSEGLTGIIDNAALYCLTDTAISSASLHWASKLPFFAPKGVPIRAAVSVFPEEIYAAPKTWTEKTYPKLIYYNRLPKGGHSPRGNSRSSSLTSCGRRRSDHYADSANKENTVWMRFF